MTRIENLTHRIIEEVNWAASVPFGTWITDMGKIYHAYWNVDVHDNKPLALLCGCSVSSPEEAYQRLVKRTIANGYAS